MKNGDNCRLRGLLSSLEKGADGIWSGLIATGQQEAERKMRQRIAVEQHHDYLRDIAKHHSVPVMDYEVCRFLNSMCQDPVILDVGGCWGWHWRKLLEQRPDACVIIIDFVRPNLYHARKMLGTLIETQIALVHADATALPFPDSMFDAIWSVQTFQHIPDFQQACREANRVLKAGGKLVTYSLHITPVVQSIYRLFGRQYHIEGMIKKVFHLTRANARQRDQLSAIFGAVVTDRYTECLFHPDLKLTFSGREGSWLGQFDARLGEFSVIGRRLARQRSFEVIKS